MDFKAAAAGEREENQPLKSDPDSQERPKNRQQVPLAYAEEVLDFLLTFTQTQLNSEDRERWIIRLSTVPAWKFQKLGEFTSPYLNEVWKFFDELRPASTVFHAPKALPAPTSSIGKDVLAHVEKIMGNGSKEQKDQWEREGITALRKKYPAHTWTCGRSANKNF